MKTKFGVRLLTVLAMALMVLGGVHPVSANTTTVWTEDWTNTYVLAAGSDANPCDFELVDSYVGSVRYVSQVNPSGTSLLSVLGDLKETLSANGKTVNIQIQGPSHSETVYYPDKIVVTTTLTGTTNLVTIPGYGLVKGGGGQAQYTEVYTLDWKFVSFTFNYRRGSLSPDWSPVCAYLAQ